MGSGGGNVSIVGSNWTALGGWGKGPNPGALGFYSVTVRKSPVHTCLRVSRSAHETAADGRLMYRYTTVLQALLEAGGTKLVGGEVFRPGQAGPTAPWVCTWLIAPASPMRVGLSKPYADF